MNSDLILLFCRYSNLDLNTKRKNATKESTAPLKIWLKERRNNPYPTKSEKVMLAISTGMTLNQVSMWFANARRRLKKENGGELKLSDNFDAPNSSDDDNTNDSLQVTAQSQDSDSNSSQPLLSTMTQATKDSENEAANKPLMPNVADQQTTGEILLLYKIRIK